MKLIFRLHQVLALLSPQKSAIGAQRTSINGMYWFQIWNKYSLISVSASPGRPFKLARTGDGPLAAPNSLPDGIYHIVNVLTGTYVGLIDGDDRSGVAGFIDGPLTQHERPGLQVPASLRGDRQKLIPKQWLVTHIGKDHYKIQNLHFTNFASYDIWPQLDHFSIGKVEASLWSIQFVQGSNTYMSARAYWHLLATHSP